MRRLSLLCLFRELSNGIVDTTRRSCWVLLVNREVLPLRLVAARSCTVRNRLLAIDQGGFERRAANILVRITIELPRSLGTHPPMHRIDDFLLVLILRWQILCGHVMVIAILIGGHAEFVLAT